MLAEKFFLVLETLRSHDSDGSPRVVSDACHVPIELPPLDDPGELHRHVRPPPTSTVS